MSELAERTKVDTHRTKGREGLTWNVILTIWPSFDLIYTSSLHPVAAWVYLIADGLEASGMKRKTKGLDDTDMELCAKLKFMFIDWPLSDWCRPLTEGHIWITSFLLFSFQCHKYYRRKTNDSLSEILNCTDVISALYGKKLVSDSEFALYSSC